MVHSRSLLLAWLLLGAAWVDEAIAGPVQVLKDMRTPRSFFRQSCLAVHRFILATSGSKYSSEPKRDINTSSPHLQSSSITSSLLIPVPSTHLPSSSIASFFVTNLLFSSGRTTSADVILEVLSDLGSTLTTFLKEFQLNRKHLQNVCSAAYGRYILPKLRLGRCTDCV
jgi:hypothetical protein